MMATLTVPKKAGATQVQQAEPEKRNDLVMMAPTPELNPRMAAFNEIAARANQQADEDASETIDGLDAPSTASELEDGDTEIDAAPEQEPALEAEEPEQEPAPVVEPSLFNPDQEYEVIVNGKPLKVSGSQIIERGKDAIRKESAADYKLQMATQLLEEAKRMQPQAKQEPVEQPLTDEQLAEIIQFGTKEQAAAAIKAIKGNQDSGKKIEEVLGRLPQVVNDQLAYHEATLFVQAEYGDLLADPDMRSLFFLKENGMRDGGDNRPYKDLYKAIGEEMRVKFNRQKQVVTKTLEQKREAKENASQVPRLAAARLEAPAEKRQPTNAEIIARMQQKRGQRPATLN